MIGGEELHKNWCRCADQSGIDAIADFSMRLCRYA
ncbi:hypothetical protein BX604_4158 [Burkholderia sp. JKS000303]|nr:hypothetical protein BX604_4158 [Burkholderia sp. JKS000303]